MECLALPQTPLRRGPFAAAAASLGDPQSSARIACFRKKCGDLRGDPAFTGRVRVTPHPRSSPGLKVQAAKKTFNSFEGMISNSEVPVLVDFYATWCGPCQVMAPVLNEVGAALKDKIKVVKVDTEKYPQVASRYRIQALPTFVLFVNGKPVNYLEGAYAKDALIAQINQVLETQKANVK